jgi:cyclopropane fatty-acyl-phospholipid synthase-like methyltransferase
MYNLMYRLGRPRWDTNVTPPEVRAIIEGNAALSPGRALDLGCGTGINVIYLAQHGWEAVGVDFSATALQQARKKAKDVARAGFVEGDVTRLKQLGIRGPFDFVLDIGCFHGLPTDRRPMYVQEVAAVTHSGTLLLMWEIADRMTSIPGAPMMQTNEIADRFGQDFVVERVESGAGRWKAQWTTLRRK